MNTIRWRSSHASQKLLPTIASGIDRNRMPKMMPMLAIVFPMFELGLTSPNPTVVNVTNMNQIACGIEWNAALPPSRFASPSR